MMRTSRSGSLSHLLMSSCVHHSIRPNHVYTGQLYLCSTYLSATVTVIDSLVLDQSSSRLAVNQHFVRGLTAQALASHSH